MNVEIPDDVSVFMPMVQTLVRHGLSGLGVLIGANGLANDSMVNDFTGLAMVGLALAWGYASHKFWATAVTASAVASTQAQTPIVVSPTNAGSPAHA
jgi:hypothetical protein